MKKWFFFLFASMLLCSCTCVLSQVPPQYIYAGAGCAALLPDYKTQVQVMGGCTGFAVTQFPLPGIELNATNKTTDVIITATGTNQKKSSIRFTVTMIDTITPKITPIGILVAYQEKQLNEIYDAGDKIAISMFKNFDKAFPWPDTVEYAKGSGPWTDSMYVEKMLINVSLDSAGTRKRVTTFGDSLIIDPSFVSWSDIREVPPFMMKGDTIDWTNVKNTPANIDSIKYMVDYREFYDWMAFGEYIPIPMRTPPTSTTPPNLSLVHAGYTFTPLIFDPVTLKMKFWNGVVWKTITSN